MSFQPIARRLRPVIQSRMGVLFPRCLSLATASRVESFALAILRRHSSALAGVAPVDAVLRARPDATVASVFQMVNSLALRIAIVSQRLSTQGSHHGGWLPPAPVSVRDDRSPQLSASRSAGQSILERLLSREQRIEAFPGRGSVTVSANAAEVGRPSPRPDPGPTGSAPVEMVMRRETVVRVGAEAARSARSVAETIGQASFDGVRASSSPPVASPFSASDVGRLTDEVVRRIDHRIIAERERKGVI